MANYKFNKPYYELRMPALSNTTINVLSFEGEEKISDLFEYRIKIVSDDPALDSSKILNNPASFILNRGDEDPIKIHGIISEFEQYGRTPDYVFYKVVLVPQLWRTKLVFQNQVYQNLNMKDLLDMILAKNGLAGRNSKIELKGKYPETDFIVQYRETDFNFLCRRCEHFGIFFYFDHSGDDDVVIFTDSNSKIPSISSEEAIGYNQNRDMMGSKESVLEISCTEKVVTGLVQLKDYNYLYPEKQLMAESQINSKHPGTYYDFGDNFQNESEAELLAKVRNQEFLAGSKVFYGTSDCRLFRSGFRMKLGNHYRDDWNGEYIITSLTSRGTQQGLFAFLPQQKNVEPTFENKFTAIPYDIDFRPVRKTPIPKVSGVMSAKLETGSADSYAYLDEHGRYKAKMLFDISDKTNAEASLPIRLLQNYSGEGYGIHFPNHAGTELLWACIDGNVDRPVGLGTVPNPSRATPVVSNNKTQNIIRTASGNEIILEDQSGETKIFFASSDGHQFDMNDKDDKIESDLKQKGLNIKSEAVAELKSTGLSVTLEGSATTDVKGGMVTVQATGPNTIKGLPVQIN
jgi:type VI secretion system secreted protein VgrG